jgi:glutamate-1-semialdehyde 2,1-aminomutase
MSDSNAELMERAHRVFPGGTLGRHYLPDGLVHVPVRGSGATIWDAEGRSYIDYSCGVGYSHPAVLAAITEQMARATQFVSILNLPAIEMAEAMLRALPWMERVRFALSGSEADFFAMRVARAHTRRDKVVKFEGAYQGNNDYSMWSYEGPAAYPKGSRDSAGIPSHIAEDVLVCPYNDLEATRTIVEANWRDIAAIIVEPVQAYYGPRPGFLEALRELATAHGIVLIFDEIVTGFRIAYGGAVERFGVVPDLGVYGKAIGGGLPLSALGGRADLMEHANPRIRASRQEDYVYVTSSQAGYPLGCTAGLATLRVLSRPSVFEAFLDRAEQLKAELRTIVKARRLDAQVVGFGPLWDVVFATHPIYDYRTAMTADHDRHLRFHVALARHGVMFRIGGRSYFSTAHEEPEIEVTLRACDAALREV